MPHKQPAPSDVVLVHSPVGGGHRAAAEALAEEARARGLSVAVLNAFDYCPPAFAASYLLAHHSGQAFAPGLYGKVYAGTKGSASSAPGGLLEPLRRGMDHLLFAPLVAEVVARRPRVVIATHHLPLLALGRARRRPTMAHPLLKAPLFGVVTDYEAHGVWAERGIEGFFVGPRRAGDGGPNGDGGPKMTKAAEDLVGAGVARARVHETGIPTKRAFAAFEAPPETREDGTLHVLFTSGGSGVGPVAEVLATFRATDPISAVVVTGNDVLKQRQLHALVKRHNLGAVVTVLGYENGLAGRLGAADIVVGKAGGLTVSEALVAGRPLLVMGSVPGNETANEAYVVEAGAALTATAAQVRSHLLALQADRRRLLTLAAAARAHGAPSAAREILDRALATAAHGDRQAPRSA